MTLAGTTHRQRKWREQDPQVLALRKHAAAGMTLVDAALKVRLPYSSAWNVADKFGITFRRSRCEQHGVSRSAPRHDVLVAHYTGAIRGLSRW